MGFADLHIHSLYSDGTYSPEKIVREAKARNVSLISVCDHNLIQGTLETQKIAIEAGITCITGVEIDSILQGRDLHILCYGADLEHEGLIGRIRYARAQLDGMSTELLKRLKDDGLKVDHAAYEAFEHDTALGGWKLLQYLVKAGIIGRMNDAFPLYERYGVTYADAGFDSLETIVNAIHAAGGKAVLAHPGVSLPTENIVAFERTLQEILEIGADGIECYYPRHGRGITQTCLRICRDGEKMITAGSDCHGAFNSNEIGCTRTGEALLELKGLDL